MNFAKPEDLEVDKDGNVKLYLVSYMERMSRNKPYRRIVRPFSRWDDANAESERVSRSEYVRDVEITSHAVWKI